jgi:hypothetical protein
MSLYCLNRLLLVFLRASFAEVARYIVVRRKRRDKWQGQWFLHHYNAPGITSLIVQQFLAEKGIPVITNHRTLQISLRATYGCSIL